MTEIYLEFSKDKQKQIQKYHDLIQQITDLSKERKVALVELKRQFSEEFLPKFEEENPEYFL